MLTFGLLAMVNYVSEARWIEDGMGGKKKSAKIRYVNVHAAISAVAVFQHKNVEAEAGRS